MEVLPKLEVCLAAFEKHFYFPAFPVLPDDLRFAHAGVRGEDADPFVAPRPVWDEHQLHRDPFEYPAVLLDQQVHHHAQLPLRLSAPFVARLAEHLYVHHPPIVLVVLLAVCLEPCDDRRARLFQPGDYLRRGEPAVEKDGPCLDSRRERLLDEHDGQLGRLCPRHLADAPGKGAPIGLPWLAHDKAVVRRRKYGIEQRDRGDAVCPREREDPVAKLGLHVHVVEIPGDELHCLAALLQGRVVDDERLPALAVVGKRLEVPYHGEGKAQYEALPVGVPVLEKAVDGVLGEFLAERSQLDLVVHAHPAEHEVEHEHHDCVYGDSLFLVRAAFGEDLDDMEALEEALCRRHALGLVAGVFHLFTGICLFLGLYVFCSFFLHAGSPLTCNMLALKCTHIIHHSERNITLFLQKKTQNLRTTCGIDC